MAVSGSGFAITFGIYAGVLAVIFLMFSIWSRLSFTRKFYAPKLFKKELENGLSRPPPKSFKIGSWIPATIRLTEDQMVASAGVDAVCYVKMLRMAWEFFLIISLVSLIIILPINCTGGYVDDLIGGTDSSTRSEFTFWLPPADETSDSEEPDAIAPPPIYDKNIPDPPAGLTWWKYLPGVPDLPTPEEYYNNASYANYGWRYDDNYVTVNYVFTGLDKTSMANIPEKSDKLYAHAIITWLVTFIAMWQFWRYSKTALRLRIYHLLNSPVGAETHTVLVTDVPGVPRGTIFDRLSGPWLKLVPQKVKKAALDQLNGAKDVVSGSDKKMEAQSSKLESETMKSAGGLDTLSEWSPPDRWQEALEEIKATGSVVNMIKKIFIGVYGDHEVSHVHSAYETAKLDALHSGYETLKGNAINAIDVAVTNHSKGKKMKPRMMRVIGPRYGAWGTEKYGRKPVKVNAYEFMRERMNYLRDEVLKSQKDSHEVVQPSAFVTFRSRRSQVVASRSLMSEDLTTWRCEAAPRPDEIVWPNLGMRNWERSLKGLIMGITFSLFTIFFLIPVAALQALLSTPSLVSWIEDIPIFGALLTGILPGLGLVIMLLLVPPIINALLRFAGRTSVSQIDAGMISMFFGFQVVTTFFGSFIAGSFANQFKQLIEDPGSIVNIFGTAAPQTAIFFSTFLMADGMLAAPIGLVKYIGLAIFWLRGTLAATPRSKEKILPAVPLDYGQEIPKDTIAILLAYQSGGLFWRQIFRQLITSMIIFQCIMIALLAIKEMIAPPLIVLPLPFLTIIYAKVVSKTFFPPMETLSMLAASKRDARDAKCSNIDKEDEDAYVNPSFKLDEREHQEVISQLSVLQKAQDAGNYDSLSDLHRTLSEDFETPGASIHEEFADVEAASGAQPPVERKPSQQEDVTLLKDPVS